MKGGSGIEQRLHLDAEEARLANEAGYGNCVIFRDDGGYNRQYLTSDGGWTVNRGEAARCLNSRAADELAKRHGVAFFGGANEFMPTCDVLQFRFPEQFKRWRQKVLSEVDAKEARLTERFVRAPHHKARNLLLAARKGKSGGTSQGNSH